MKRTGSMVHWKKVAHIQENEHNTSNTLHGEINYNLVSQGELGNCWLISAISALAIKPQIITNLFTPNQQLQKFGLFKGTLNHKSKPEPLTYPITPFSITSSLVSLTAILFSHSLKTASFGFLY
jgi:hypothetical protein